MTQAGPRPEQSPQERQERQQILAAVDLGSNSFHMIVARHQHGEVRVIDRLREMVRLAAGLEDRGRISRSSRRRAISCLGRFGQRLRDVHAANVRAVGTNTLRKAKNADEFLEDAEAALGHPIEVVSGREEARLVYLGAAHTLPESEGRRLVVDIGGGSTELIVGEGFETRELFSLYMGCVSLTERFFPGGKLSAKRWQRARLAAAVELEPVKALLRSVGWVDAIGTSGTIRTARAVARAAGWSDGEINVDVLEKLAQRLVESTHVERLSLEGLSAERAPVFPGGIVILQSVMAELGIERLRVAGGALREGLVYDMLGRLSDEDVRDRSVRALQQRYHVDTAQAGRVERTALQLFSQVRDDWRLQDPLAEKLLSWAARLHEMGLAIAHSRYHRHGAYLLEHSDVPGFSNREKALLARLVLTHRRKIRPDHFADRPKPWHRRLLKLAVLLRLSVLLHRGRGPEPLPEVAISVSKKTVNIRLPAAFLELHPLTRADLESERRCLAVVDLRLELEET